MEADPPILCRKGGEDSVKDYEIISLIVAILALVEIVRNGNKK